MATIFGKEPAIIIGTVVTIVIATITTLSGNGFISDAAAGKAVDITNAIAQLLLLLAPLITAALIRPNVYAPASVETGLEDAAPSEDIA